MQLTELFKKQLLKNNEAHKMKLDKFIPWFETTYLQKTTFNFGSINVIMQDLNLTMFNLSNLVNECRIPLATQTNPSNRMQRLCDQIDLLHQEYQSGKQCKVPQTTALYPHNSLLPDSEYLRDLTNKIKSKLKVIEEVSMSRKADSGKAKGGRSDGNKKPFEMPQSIREEIRKLSGLVESLEIESIGKSMLLSHFNDLKAMVHRPFYQMRLAIAELPNIQIAKQQLTQDLEAFHLAGELYNAARSAEVLRHMVQLRHEVHDLEATSDSMFLCIREFVGGVHSKDCLALLKDDAPQSASTGAINSSSLVQRLSKYCKSTPSDLLHLATLKE